MTAIGTSNVFARIVPGEGQPILATSTGNFMCHVASIILTSRDLRFVLISAGARTNSIFKSGTIASGTRSTKESLPHPAEIEGMVLGQGHGHPSNFLPKLPLYPDRKKFVSKFGQTFSHLAHPPVIRPARLLKGKNLGPAPQGRGFRRNLPIARFSNNR